ncbi:MAG: ASCH domain-containing protein [Spirulina sp. SIO3F2]|nr:ASCH domain-containing protein [Spirulina sp. SIO3F2]
MIKVRFSDGDFNYFKSSDLELLTVQKPRIALTIKQPWAWAITQLNKNVENRNWATDYRGLLYVHAGKAYDKVGHQWLAEAIGATIPTDLPCGGIVGAVELVDCRRDAESDWAMPDQWHWCLEGARSLPFEAMPGRLKLWQVKEAS